MFGSGLRLVSGLECTMESVLESLRRPSTSTLERWIVQILETTEIPVESEKQIEILWLGAGAFIVVDALLPLNMDGMVHVSQIATHRVAEPADESTQTSRRVFSFFSV